MVDSPTHQTRLRVLRAERRLTQMKTAKLAAMSPTRYWHIESGEGVPTKDELDALAKAFGVPVKSLGVRSAPSREAAAS